MHAVNQNKPKMWADATLSFIFQLFSSIPVNPLKTDQNFSHSFITIKLPPFYSMASLAVNLKDKKVFLLYAQN